MGLFRGFFQNFLNSLIISSLFALVGISLFVGDFPPSVSKVKKVFAQFQNLRNVSQAALEKSLASNEDDFGSTYSAEKHKVLSKFAKSRNNPSPKTYQDYVDQIDAIGPEGEGASAPDGESLSEGRPQRNVASQNGAKSKYSEYIQDAPPTRAEIPAEWQNKFYQMQSEIFRLNQRVLELKKKQMH